MISKIGEEVLQKEAGLSGIASKLKKLKNPLSNSTKTQKQPDWFNRPLANRTKTQKQLDRFKANSRAASNKNKMKDRLDRSQRELRMRNESYKNLMNEYGPPLQYRK